jgi:hypothetical protein
VYQVNICLSTISSSYQNANAEQHMSACSST